MPSHAQKPVFKWIKPTLGGLSLAPQSNVGFEGLDPRRSYYGFGMGRVYVLMLDSETPSHPGSPQGEFVAAELAKVSGGGAGW
jgi:hypothetical protein